MSKPTVFIGIDPGQSGGVSIISDRGLLTQPIPKTEGDVWGLFKILSGPRTDGGHSVAVIEKVNAQPNNAVRAAFKFGQNYGFLRACLIAAEIPFTEVTPRTWMKGLGIRTRKKTETKTQWKNYLKGLAQQWYPGIKFTHATADATLIARYCQQFTLFHC